jgi:hypothetical protein
MPEETFCNRKRPYKVFKMKKVVADKIRLQQGGRGKADRWER